jgi:ribonuclease P protein component
MKVINRIKKTTDFGKTINTGHSFRLPSYIVHVKENEYGYTRVGISASSKLGCAVVRNRAKRQVRAICDSVIKYDERSLDVVIIIKHKFLVTSFDDNKSQLCDLMKGL